MVTRYLLLLSLLLCLGLKSYPQNQKIDSLQSVFESAASDSVRLLACKELTTKLAGIDSAKAEVYVVKGISLSEQLSDPEARLFFESQRARFLLNKNAFEEAIDLCNQILSQVDYKDYALVTGNCNEILGNIYLKQSNYKKAQYYLEKGLAYHESKHNNEKTASLLSTLGIVHEQLGNLKEALVYLNKSLSITKDLGDEQATALNTRYLGAVYNTQGFYEKALKYFDESLEIERKANHEFGIASCLFEISNTYARLGKYTEANSYCEKAIKIFNKTGDIREVILLTTHIGINNIMVGRYDQAITYLNAAAKLAEINKAQYLMSGIYMHLAIVYIEQGNFDKGVQHFSYSLELEKETGNQSKILALLNNIGYAYQLQGNVDSAFFYYRRSLKYNDFTDAIKQSFAYTNIGLCYLKYLNDEDSAFYYLKKANNIYLQQDNKKALRSNFEKIGHWYTTQGNILKALSFYEEALEIVEKADDSLGIAYILEDLASVYKSQQSWDEAIAYQEKALNILALTSNIPASSRTKINLAELYVKKGSYQRAIQLASDARKNFLQLQDSCQLSSCYLILGTAFASLNPNDSAIHYLEMSSSQAKRCNEHIISANADIQLGKIYDSDNQTQKAFALYQLALENAKLSRDRESVKDAAAYLFPIYQEKGQYKKAFETLNLYQANRDSLFNAENTRNLVQKELEMVYAEAEQEKELFQQKEDALKNSQLERQQWIIYTSLGAFIAMLVIAIVAFRNYRNKQKANDLLRRQKKELEELDQSKSRLFANISHELRTPLTLISGPVESLIGNEETYNSASAQKLELIKRNSQQLKGLVDDILDLSKLESNKIELHEKPTLLEPFLNKIFSNFESLASHLGIRYQAKSSGLSCVWAMVDTSKVEKVINNLLSNAIKHTPLGGTVELSVLIKEDKIVMAVSDTGYGIAKADLPLIFDRFYQSKQPDAPIQGGTGIGLALAKELTHLMNGKIEVVSEEGKGSTFTLSIPYKATEAVARIEFVDEEIAEEINLDHLLEEETDDSEKKFHVLIVEDHPDMQLFLREILNKKYHLYLANNGKKALDILENGQSMDLIISDVMMPEMDGYALLEHLKSSDRYKQIPVIMLTALDTNENKLNALTLGVDDYLTKPFSTEELLARAHNLLLRHESRIMANKLVLEQSNSGELEGVTLYRELNDEEPSIAHETDIEWLEKIAEVIRLKLEDPEFQVIDLADSFYMSERQFYRKMKQVTGMTPRKYQQEVALQKARHLLESRQYGNVTAVCFAVGMSNVSRFSQLYQARFGKKPKEYFGEKVR